MSIKAVILAAGRGSRMDSLTEDMPKSLLELTQQEAENEIKTSFLERHISCLNKAGVHDIAVVVSYKKENVLEKLSSHKVTFIENTTESISSSGSLHSFQFAINSEFAPLDGKSHTLLMDADIIYNQHLIDQFIQSLRRTSILISGRFKQDSEEVRIYGENRRPVFIGKGLQPMMVNWIPCLGEATGITHYAPEDHELIRSLTNWLLGNPNAEQGSLERKGFGPAKQLTEHEELAQRLMLLFKMEAYILERDYLFSEVDTQEEYEFVKTSLFPKILAHDRTYLPSF